MDEFSYLSVLVSIILGLGITQLLAGVAHLIRSRSRIQWYGPALTWVGLLIVIHIQTWWAMFGLRAYQGWNFFGFLIVLLHPVALYLLAALVLPDFADEGPVDLRANYFAQARWFFSLAMLVILLSLVRPLVLGGVVRPNLDVAVQVAFLLLTGGAALIRADWYHKTAALLTATMLALYIGALFANLQ